jgi:hypothetical protein
MPSYGANVSGASAYLPTVNHRPARRQKFLALPDHALVAVVVVPSRAVARLIQQHLEARPILRPGPASSCQNAFDSLPLLVEDGGPEGDSF